MAIYQKRISYKGVGFDSRMPSGQTRAFWVIKNHGEFFLRSRDLIYNNIADEDCINGMAAESFSIGFGTYNGVFVALIWNKWYVIYSLNDRICYSVFDKEMKIRLVYNAYMGKDGITPRIFQNGDSFLITYIDKSVKASYVVGITTSDFLVLESVKYITDLKRDYNNYVITDGQYTLKDYIDINNYIHDLGKVA